MKKQGSQHRSCPFAGAKRFLALNLTGDSGTDEVEFKGAASLLKPRNSEGFSTLVTVDLETAWNQMARLPAFVSKEQFLFDDVCKIAGVSTKNGERLAMHGIIQPSSGSSGRGVQRIFSFTDAFIAGVVGSMNRRGLTQKTLLVVADRLRRFFNEQASHKKADVTTARD